MLLQPHAPARDRLLPGPELDEYEAAVKKARLKAADVKAIAVRRDGTGHLVLPKGEAKALQKLAGAPVVIYVQKISR